MKKMYMVLCLYIFCINTASAQVGIVSAPALEAIMGNHLAQAATYYVDAVKSQVESVMHAYNQVQAMIRAEERAIKNLAKAKDIKSPKEALNWFNRQLYLEKQAEASFNSIGVDIGGTKYTLKEIDDIPDALRSTFVDPLGTEFSPEQQKKIWTDFGLSPSNYVYIQTWAERDRKIAKSIIGSPDVINEENKIAAARNKEIMTNVAVGDPGEKQLAANSLEVQVDTNNAVRAMAYNMAERNALDAARQKLTDKPANTPRLSESYNTEYFDKIGEDLE